MLEMPHAIIVDKRDISSGIAILDTRTTGRTTRDTNPEAEAVIIPLGITDLMIDPDPETEANLGIEIIIVLDMIDPGAEASLVIDTEITETTTLLIDPDHAIDHLLLILVMFTLSTLPMIIPMNNLKPF